MLTVDHFALIRQLRRDGLTIRQIADQLHRSPKTVLKALSDAVPTPYTLAEPRPAPVFGPFRAIVDAILEADESAPRKQRHTATQIHRRLAAEFGYAGSYDPIRRHLKERRLARRETFIPLDHRPGVRAEADFGHIQVDLPDGRRPVPVLVVTWSYSNAPFALALPTERTEAVLHGLVEAFAFFGCVPTELWWDNPTTVAIHIWSGRERTMHPRYAALASHYLFTPKFCLPAAATEKPRVENRVYDLERQWATPVPQVKDLAELNAHLRRCCLAARERRCGANTETVAARFADDARAARWAFRPVTVKGYVDRVAVVADGQVVATHRRSYGRREKVLDPRHFLGILAKKPAALDHAPVYRDWDLPAAFAELRQALEARLGPSAGVRQYIRVVQLLDGYPIPRVEAAIRQARLDGEPDAEAIRARVERAGPDPPVSSFESKPAAAIAVPRPDLSRFNRLLPRSPEGADADESTDPDAAQGQPEAAQAADHAGRA